MDILTVQEMRELEQAAAESGLDYLRLMENAGSAAARVIRGRYQLADAPVVVLCGSGNNGGDGFVIARKLLEEGARVSIALMAGKPVTPQAAEMFARIAAVVPAVSYAEDPGTVSDMVHTADLIVDAVFGIGFHGGLPDNLRPLFRQINRAAVPVAAADIPSGMNANTGAADPDALKAEITVTFTAAKPGFFADGAENLLGQLIKVSIGIPPELVAKFTGSRDAVDFERVKKCFAPRDPDSHKGTYGHLLCVGGSYGMAGAIGLCAKAALRCGTGLVTVALPEKSYPIVAAGLPEAVYLPLSAAGDNENLLIKMKSATAIAAGCGMGVSAASRETVLELLRQTGCPLVLDADGLNILADIDHTDLHIYESKTGRVLTPHPGEMARLLRCRTEDVQADRTGAVRKAAELYNCTVVLKGHQTLIASPHQPVLQNPTGNPGMATGGSGDVLAGMIGAFLAQGMEPRDAAICGVWLHGAAGDIAAARLSQHYMLPSDLIGALPELFMKLEK